MKYKTVAELYLEVFNEGVNELLADGWEIVGGVSATPFIDEWRDSQGYKEREIKFLYAQALVKR